MSDILSQLLGDRSGENLLNQALELAARKQAAGEKERVKQEFALAKKMKEEALKVEKLRNDNLQLLSEPSKLDSMVTDNYLPLLPSNKKPEDSSEYFNKSEMLDASMPENHPQRGRVTALKEAFKERLSSEEGSVRPAALILQDMIKAEYNSVKEDAFRYKREADSSLLNIILPESMEGLTKDENVRALPGYEEWLERERKLENTRFWQETTPEKYVKGVGKAALVGAGTAVAATAGLAVLPTIPFVTAGLTALAGSGLVSGALTTAGEFALFELGMKPAADIFEASDWYNANAQGTAIDKAQAGITKFGVSMAGGIAALRIAKNAAKAVTERGMKTALNDRPMPLEATGMHTQPEMSQAMKNQRYIESVMAGDSVGTEGSSKLVPGSKAAQEFIDNSFRDYNTLASDLLKNVNAESPLLNTIGAGELVARNNPLVRKVVSRELVSSDIQEAEVIFDSTAKKEGFKLLSNDNTAKPLLTYDKEIVAAKDRLTGSNAAEYEQFLDKTSKPLYTYEYEPIKLRQEERVALMLEPPRRTIPEPVAKSILAKLPPEEQQKVLTSALHPKIGSVETAVVEHLDTKKVVEAVKAVDTGLEVLPGSRIFKTSTGKEIKYRVSPYDGTIAEEDANVLYKYLEPHEQELVRKMAKESTIGHTGTGVREVLRRREAKTIGSFAWKEKIRKQTEAGKEVPMAWKRRAYLEDTDPAKIVELQAAGKLTLRQADLLKKGGDSLTQIKSEETKRILKKLGIDPATIVGVGMFSLGSIPLSAALSDSEAEAGVLDKLATSIPKMFAAGAKNAYKEGHIVEYLNDMKAIKQVVVRNANPREMPEQLMQQFSVAKYAEEAYGSLAESIKDVGGTVRGQLGKIMSPGFYGDLLQKTKARVSVQLASLEATIAGNTGAVKQVYNNIAERVPGLKGNHELVIKEMEELTLRHVKEAAPYMKAVSEIEMLETTYKNVEGIVGLKGKAYKDAIRAAMDKSKAEVYDNLLLEKEKYKESYKLWNAAVEAKYKDLAVKYPGTRIALAAEDTAEFTTRPWLKAMMTLEELEATAYIQKMYLEYGKRIADVGHDIITKKPYVHHPIHPALVANKEVQSAMQDMGLLPGKGIPYTKFFTRAKMSKQLVPDIDYIMNKYIPDAEKRIQWTSFWREWEGHASAMSKLPGHADFWAGLKKVAVPHENIPLYQMANRYYQFEVIRLIGFSASAALKHLFKLEGTVANFGIRETFKHFPEANKQAARLTRNYLSETKIGEKLGFKFQEAKTATDELVDSFLSTSRYQQTFAEMALDAGMADSHKIGLMSKVDNILKTTADLSSLPIKYVEWLDRAHSVLAIRDLSIAERAVGKGIVGPKKGLTAFDAAYNTWDTMIKMNFMGGSLNPGWQRNPFVRSVFMFQNTPAKLLERRLVNTINSGDSVLKAGKHVFKGYQSQVAALNEVQGIMRYIKAAENTWKAGIFGDAVKIMNELKTPTGQPYYKQFLADLLFSGGLIYGGGKFLDVDLKSHVFHLPMLKSHEEKPTLSISPVISGMYKTLEQNGEDNDDMFMTRFAKNWLGRNGLIPMTIYKGMRMTEHSIPKIYKDSEFKYLFSLPATKK